MRILVWAALAALIATALVVLAYYQDMRRAYDRVDGNSTVISSALLFAVLYPERVSSLTLISCGVAASGTQDQAGANEKGDMLVTIFKHDILYWAAAKFFKKQLMGLIGASDEVVAGLTDEQKRLFERFIDEMNPASLRAAGALFDNKAVMPGERIASIAAPTLILHATDDGLQLFHNAEFAEAQIPHAKLIRFEKGGHFLIGLEQPAIRAAVAGHILGHTGAPWLKSLEPNQLPYAIMQQIARKP